jgi:DNA-directed RNA polymerase subunit M/transcription elongation factor TFIIS
MIICPQCKTILMTEKKESIKLLKVHCMKCGKEYEVKEGQLFQKKKRVKKIPPREQKITISLSTGPNGMKLGIDDKHLRLLQEQKKHSELLKELERLRMIQEQVAKITRHKI